MITNDSYYNTNSNELEYIWNNSLYIPPPPPK